MNSGVWAVRHRRRWALAALLIGLAVWWAWPGGSSSGLRFRFAVPQNGFSAWTTQFSPDGAFLWTAGPGGEKWLWHVATGRRLQGAGLGEGRSAVAFSPDGRWIASLADQVRITPRILVHDRATFAEVARLDHDRDFTPVLTFSPDGSTLRAFGVGGDSELPGSYCEWETTGWTLVQSRHFRFPSEAGSMRLWPSPDARRVAFMVGRSVVVFWDILADRELARWDIAAGVPGASISRVSAFDRDGARLLVGRSDGVVETRRAVDGVLEGSVRLFPPGFPVQEVATDHRGRLALAQALDRTEPVLLAWARDVLHRLTSGPTTWFNNRYLESVLWDRATGRILARFPRGTVPVLSPDGRFVALHEPTRISVWEVPQ